MEDFWSDMHTLRLDSKPWTFILEEIHFQLSSCTRTQFLIIHIGFELFAATGVHNLLSVFGSFHCLFVLCFFALFKSNLEGLCTPKFDPAGVQTHDLLIMTEYRSCH